MRIFQGQMSQFMSIPPFRSSSSTMRSSSPMEYWVPAWGIGSRVVNRGTGPWSPHRALVLRMQNAMPPIFGTCHAVGPKPHLAPLLDPGKDLPRTTAVEGSFGLQLSFCFTGLRARSFQQTLHWSDLRILRWRAFPGLRSHSNTSGMQVVLLWWVVCAAPMRLTATSEAKIPLGDACELPPLILGPEILFARNREG